jgi:hypothetical protein
MTTFRCEEVRLRTDISSRVGLGVVFLGMAAFCAYAAVDGAGIFGVIAASVCISIWLYWATLELVIGPDMVIVRRFWRSAWQARRSTVTAETSLGGETKLARCLRLHSEDEVRPFEMLQSLFGEAALSQAQLMLEKP